jgi:hypothetical protein
MRRAFGDCIRRAEERGAILEASLMGTGSGWNGGLRGCGVPGCENAGNWRGAEGNGSPAARAFSVGMSEETPNLSHELPKQASRVFRYEVSQSVTPQRGGCAQVGYGDVWGVENVMQCRRPPHFGHRVISIPSKTWSHSAAVCGVSSATGMRTASRRRHCASRRRFTQLARRP